MNIKTLLLEDSVNYVDTTTKQDIYFELIIVVFEFIVSLFSFYRLFLYLIE